jgi:hypothetical protein
VHKVPRRQGKVLKSFARRRFMHLAAVAAAAEVEAVP